MRKILILLLLLAQSVWALSISTTAIDDGSSLTIRGQANTVGSLSLTLKNDKADPVTVRIQYQGTAVNFYYNNALLNTGATYIDRTFNLDPNVSINIKLETVLDVSKSGVLYIYENGTLVYTRLIKFIPETQTQPQQQDYSNCLVPVVSKVIRSLMLNESLSLTIYFKNVCNVSVRLLDFYIEGVPSIIAKVVSADLGKLDSYELWQGNILVDTSKLTSPRTLNFNVVLIGEYSKYSYVAKTNVEIIVYSEELTKPEEEEEKPKEVVVQYSTEGNKLVILSVYPPDAKVVIMYDNQQISYYGPIQLKPNSQYCIYGYKEGYTAFYKCFTTPAKSLCYDLNPKPKNIGGLYYYKLGTNVSIDVYDCDTNEPVQVNILVNGVRLDGNEFTIEDEKVSISIRGPQEYKPIDITLHSYEPLSVDIPLYAGNVTITVSGSGSQLADVKLYYPNGTLIYEGKGNNITLELSPGYYRIVVKTQYDELTKDFYLYSTVPEQKGIAIPIWMYVLGGIILFLLIAYLYTKRKEHIELSTIADKIRQTTEELKK